MWVVVVCGMPTIAVTAQIDFNQKLFIFLESIKSKHERVNELEVL